MYSKKQNTYTNPWNKTVYIKSCQFFKKRESHYTKWDIPKTITWNPGKLREEDLNPCKRRYKFKKERKRD